MFDFRSYVIKTEILTCQVLYNLFILKVYYFKSLLLHNKLHDAWYFVNLTFILSVRFFC